LLSSYFDLNSMKFVATGASLLILATAQYFPPKPEGVTVLQSRTEPGVTISYKEVRRVATLRLGPTDNCLAAWYLRDNTGREIVCRICQSPSQYARGCPRSAELYDQHVLLVLRVEEGSSECTPQHLDEWRPRKQLVDRAFPRY